jgi:hypothetical protein
MIIANTRAHTIVSIVSLHQDFTTSDATLENPPFSKAPEGGTPLEPVFLDKQTFKLSKTKLPKALFGVHGPGEAERILCQHIT